VRKVQPRRDAERVDVYSFLQMCSRGHSLKTQYYHTVPVILKKNINRIYASFMQLSLPLAPSHTQQILSDTVRPEAGILAICFTLKFAE